MRLAVVGCGAIAEHGHLPAAVATESINLQLLVDRNIENATALAETFGVPHVSSSLDEIEEFADAAIVCVPPSSHLGVCKELLGRGIHVLVEKPMALSVRECEEMICAADQNAKVLAVAMVRRHFLGDRFVKKVLESGLFGCVRSFSIENGSPYEWPAKSKFIVYKNEAGGGVLMGLGCHILDAIIWWFGNPKSIRYLSDAMGGMETECRLELTFSNSIEGIIELSRNRSLGNSYRICFERAVLEVSHYDDSLVLEIQGLESTIAGELVSQEQQSAVPGTSDPTEQAFINQLESFRSAIHEGTSPIISGIEALSSMRLIEQCYREPEHLSNDWTFPIQVSIQ